MNVHLGLIAVLIGLAGVHNPVLAQMGRPLDGGVSSSTTIVIGRLDQYIAEPETLDRLVEQQMRTSPVIGGNAAATVMRTIQQRGTYSFTVLSELKGQAPDRLLVRLPRLTSESLLLTGSDEAIPLKGTYLLILGGTELQGYSAAYRAPIRISDRVEAPPKPDEARPAETYSTVVQVLVDSLADPAMRKSAAYILREATGEAAANAMRAYVDDPDDDLRESALECLATNQDVTIIPKMMKWQYSSPNRNGNPLTTSIRKFRTPAAIPYLNELLLDQSSQYIRLNAVSTLRQLPPDKSSIPYLMKVLRDENFSTRYDAYRCLYQMIPELGAPLNVPDYRADPESQIRPIEEWWTNQQPATRPQ